MTKERGLAAPGESYYWDLPSLRSVHTIERGRVAVKGLAT